MKALSRMKRRGFTMIETVLVIAVGLSLMTGGIIYYQGVNASTQSQNVILASVPVITGIRKIADTHGGNFFMVTQKTVADQGHIPEKLNRGDHFVTPDGVRMRITTPAPYDHAVLHFLSLDGALCKKVLQPSSPLISDEMRPSQIWVNGVAVERFGAVKHCETSLPNEIRLSYR